MLQIDNTFLLLIDMQDKLYRAMHDKEDLLENVRKLIMGIKAFGIPIVMSEQYPEGIGKTIPEVAELLPDTPGIRKLSFSCCADRECNAAMAVTERNQALIAGIEAHVCVYQTAMDLLDGGYEVQVVADAVSSRSSRNRDIGLQKMRDAGVVITSVEIALFELLRTAESGKFREISKILK
jgi:nicotinamidase-related amidase